MSKKLQNYYLVGMVIFFVFIVCVVVSTKNFTLKKDLVSILPSLQQAVTGSHNSACVKI